MVVFLKENLPHIIENLEKDVFDQKSEISDSTASSFNKSGHSMWSVVIPKKNKRKTTNEMVSRTRSLSTFDVVKKSNRSSDSSQTESGYSTGYSLDTKLNPGRPGFEKYIKIKDELNLKRIQSDWKLDLSS